VNAHHLKPLGKINPYAKRIHPKKTAMSIHAHPDDQDFTVAGDAGQMDKGG